MGVLHGSSVLYYAKGLQIKDVVAIAKGLAADRGMATPTIDVDCSNVCFKVGKNVQHLANFLMRWSDPGLCITPVCDNTIRPISKQATNKRKADRERNRIKASILRKDIRELRRRFYEEPNNRQAIQEEISKKEKACKTAETAAANSIQSNMKDKLVVELERSSANKKNNAGGFVAEVLVAEFQADALMMGRSISQSTLMVMSSDADIPIVAGDQCLVIRSSQEMGESN
mmetsp:Transcript_3043/g.6682  ORF Transcript_3043/g.6682 Transcript_3043/m.6682 type:complete len:229 (+) Transcript_3043:133-819(+)